MTAGRNHMPRYGLVLSGGFLRSAFQVGVIEALHASGIQFDVVVGVSSGAWNAACVAAGQISEMRGWWMEVAAAPKWSLKSLWRNRTPLNFRTIVDTIPARAVRFDRLATSSVRLCIGVTRLRDWTFHVFDSADGPCDFFRIVMASNYLPVVYGTPIALNGCYYADGGLIDNVPYEAALRLGCERVFVVVPEPDGGLRKSLFARVPHQIDAAVRERVRVIHPRRPLRVGRLAATPESVRDCIEAGHDAVAQENLHHDFDMQTWLRQTT